MPNRTEPDRPIRFLCFHTVTEAIGVLILFFLGVAIALVWGAPASQRESPEKVLVIEEAMP